MTRLFFLALMSFTSTLQAAEKELQAIVRPALDHAVDYLRTARNDDGSFGDGEMKVALTAMVVAGLLQSEAVPDTDPLVTGGFELLESKVKQDGSIDVGRGGTYVMSVCVMTFSLGNKDKKYQETIDRTVAFLKGAQFDESEGVKQDDSRYGGMGYGGPSRPDLSNTAYMLDALRAAGVAEDDPAYQRAVVFIRRCQNLSGEGANDLPIGEKINDGGFFYTPVPGGGGRGEEGDAAATGGLRSYGSMTYAGLKSFLYAGVEADDFRVKAAYDWVKKHYSVDENPGQGDAGLYYYYHTFAKALAALGVDEVIDAEQKSHDWRRDLVEAIVQRQNEDGSWTNKNRRWMEDDPRLATAFALLSLGQAIKSPASGTE